MSDIYPIGTKTKFGKVVGILRLPDEKERYYFIQDEKNSIAFMPQSAMEGLKEEKKMTLKIVQNHIPRTIYGVKYDIRREDGILEKNRVVQFDRVSGQQGYIKNLKTQPNVSEITELRWHINPDYQQKIKQSKKQ